MDEVEMMKSYEHDDGPEDVHPTEVIDHGDSRSSVELRG